MHLIIITHHLNAERRRNGRGGGWLPRKGTTVQKRLSSDWFQNGSISVQPIGLVGWLDAGNYRFPVSNICRFLFVSWTQHETREGTLPIAIWIKSKLCAQSRTKSDWKSKTKMTTTVWGWKKLRKEFEFNEQTRPRRIYFWTWFPFFPWARPLSKVYNDELTLRRARRCERGSTQEWMMLLAKLLWKIDNRLINDEIIESEDYTRLLLAYTFLRAGGVDEGVRRRAKGQAGGWVCSPVSVRYVGWFGGSLSTGSVWLSKIRPFKFELLGTFRCGLATSLFQLHSGRFS